MIYLLKDFLLSRNGKVLMLCIVIVVSSFYASKHTKNSTSSRPLPQNNPSDLWTDTADNTETNYRRKGKNTSFELFVPPTPKVEAPVAKEVAPPRKAPMEIASKELPPLIKEQRKSVAATPPEQNIPILPALEEGALIQCRLLSSATTDSSNCPVTAEVTHAVIRDGITLIPKGSKITGVTQRSVNDRVFFAPEWRVNLRPNVRLTLKAHVQERSCDLLANRPNSSDGQSGLPGTIHNAQKTDESKLLPALAKSLTRFGQETVRTGVGEFVPATGRNLALEGSSALIDHLAKPADGSAPQKQMFVEVPAGQEFYLMILSANAAADSHPAQPPSIDQLLEKLAKKRLDE